MGEATAVKSLKPGEIVIRNMEAPHSAIAGGGVKSEIFGREVYQYLGPDLGSGGLWVGTPNGEQYLIFPALLTRAPKHVIKTFQRAKKASKSGIVVAA